MKVTWIEVDHEPEVNKYGVSGQLVLLTNIPNYNVGYWNSVTRKWEVLAPMQHKEYVVCWLRWDS